jgi:flagellar motor switch protein FliN/FliY
MGSSAYDWVRTISPELKALDAIPLTGAAPPFPWQDLASYLSNTFDRELTIEPGPIEWRKKEQFYEGLGESLFPLVFAIPSLKGIACWIMPEQEILILESLLLTKDPHPISFQDRSLSESFYRFLALEVLYNISQTHFASLINPILLSQSTLPEVDSLCWDIAVHVQGKTLWGRLIISPDLRQSWVEHFAKEKLSPLGQNMASKVDILAHLEVGYTQITLKEWSQVSLGDWILLEKCSLNPLNLEGQVHLTIHGKIAFVGNLNDHHIQIVERPSYQEVDTLMAKEIEDEDDFTDFDESMDSDDFEDTDLIDEDLDLQDEDFNQTENLISEPPTTPLPTPTSKPKQGSDTGTKTQRVPGTTFIKPEEIPVSLVIEIGRIQMTIEKLLQLEPGNLLELDIHPENGVDLVINGKTVGKGELIRIGEALGVRITELGR